MARPQTPFTPKPGKQRNTRPDKMRMSHIRLQQDLKRIEAEQAKAEATRTAKPRRKWPATACAFSVSGKQVIPQSALPGLGIPHVRS